MMEFYFASRALTAAAVHMKFQRLAIGLTVKNTICIFASHCLKRAGRLPHDALRNQSAITTWEFVTT